MDSIDARLDFERNNASEDDIELERVASEEEDYASSPADYNILTYPADFTLEVLYQKWRQDEIKIPEFQRAFVWKPAQSSRLIESFLVGLPVPPVYVFVEHESQKYLVIDGQQRLRSIFQFLEGSFAPDSRGRRRPFRLVGLSADSRFTGRAFEELWEDDQRKLKNSVLRAFIVKQLEPGADTSMYHIFERLNTGGTLLNNQEIRNCIFRGGFVQLLADLNLNNQWRNITGKPAPDSRKRDVELIVRFFAMQDRSGYWKPMKDFLSRFMYRNRDMSEESLQKYEAVFQETCAQVTNSLGAKPFHIHAGLNAAVMDSVMAAFAGNLARTPQDIRSRYDRLLADAVFQDNTSKGTTDVNVIDQRFTRAEQILFG